MSTLAQWSTGTAVPASDVMTDMTDMEAHVQQTNDRLLCIQQQLAVAGESFQSSARELLEWCSDMRAFQPHFEQRLFGCLMVINQVAAQPGFDLDLGYRLLAVCAAHGDKFSPKSAGALTSWCEELGRLLMLRHQSSRPSVSATDCMPSALKTNQEMQWQYTQPTAHIGGSVDPSSMSVAPATGWVNSPPPPTGQQSSLRPTIAGHMIAGGQGPATGSGSQFMAQGGTAMPVSSNQMAGFNDVGPVGGMAGKYGGGYGSVRQQGPFYNQNGFPATSAGLMAAQDMMSSGPMVSAAGPMSGPVGVGGGDELCLRPSNPQLNSQQVQMGNMANMQQMYGMPYGAQYPAQYGQRMGSANGQVGAGGHIGPGPVMAQQGMMQAGAGPMPNVDEPAMVGGAGPVKGAGGKAGMYAQQQQRPTPYPNPQQYMQSKRAHFVNGQTQQEVFGMAQQYGMGPTGQGYTWPATGRPGCPPTHMSPNYGNGQPRSNASGYCGGPATAQGAYMVSGQCRPAGSGGYHPQFVQGSGYTNNLYGGNQPLSPMMTAGNPVSSKMNPVLGATGVPPSYNSLASVPPSYNSLPVMPPSYGSPPPGVDIKPVMVNGKMEPGVPPVMMVKKEESTDDLRLTFPVRDGVVLPPFRLEHNLAVSNHVFHLRESVYQTLMWRSDLELQLKCFHHEDRQMATNWPISVSISVNQTMLSIDRSVDSTASHRPLYLKEVCQPGRNMIQITVSACCCSHLFVLQLVHRPSVRSVLQGLLRKRLLPAEHCISKIKRSFIQPGVSSAMMGGVMGEGGDEMNTIKLSLKCPITYRSITLPARGHDCKHIQCFDLESYLQLNCERGLWRCPICNKSALLEGLEIDQYIWGILNNLSGTEFEEVTLDPTASWKPVPLKHIKEEDTKRWTKAISPSSMNLPTMSSWQEVSGAGNGNFYRGTTAGGQPPTSVARQQSHHQQQQQQQQQPPPPQQFQAGMTMGPYDRGPGNSPCFSPIGTPDFLSSLSHMGDNLLHGGDVKPPIQQMSADGQIRQPRTPLDGQMTNTGHLRTGADGSLSHPPRTPLESGCQNPRTPLDSQGMQHPRTPLDGQLRTPLDGQNMMHPRTPLDGGSCGTAYPRTPIDGQMANPRTPLDSGLSHTDPGPSSASSDISSLRPTPGTPGSNPRTPSSCGGRANGRGNGNVVAVVTAAGNAAAFNNNNSCSSIATSSFTDSSQSATATSTSATAGTAGGCLMSPDFTFDSDGRGQDALDLLQDGIGDPAELLSYLGPSADGANGGIGGSNADDLLSLFT